MNEPVALRQKPARIAPGDQIGVVSISSPISEDQLRAGVAYLEGRGHPVRLADGLLDSFGHVAGSAERRAAGVMSMFADPDIALVLPTGGGWGACHLVDLLDYEVVRANPKVFTGFSNPTTLNNAILATTGLPSLHGINGFGFSRSKVHPRTEEAFWAMVSGRVAGREVDGDGWRVHRADSPTVVGPLVGGNLPAVLPLVGTPWMPSTEGAILLIEAMDSTYPQVDSCLTHLRLAGVFDGIAALVIGAPANWDVGPAIDRDVDDLVLRCVGGDFPVITNVGYGHQADRILLPIGCLVEFDLRGGRPILRYLEDLVA